MRRLITQIYLDILKICMSPQKPTHLANEMNTDYTSMKKHIQKLINLGHLQKIDPENHKNKKTKFRLKTTFKGAQLLSQHRSLMRALEELS